MERLLFLAKTETSRSSCFENVMFSRKLFAYFRVPDKWVKFQFE